MSKNVFIFKEKNTDDRDCVKYIDVDRFGRLELGHYFPRVNLTGACFSMGLESESFEHSDITTILTESEFEQLKEYNREIDELGYGIKQGDDRYDKGMELYEGIKNVIDKLLSDENEELFNKIIDEEKSFIESEYNLSSEEVDLIFNEYQLEYQDRGIIGSVYNDIGEASYEEANSLGYVDGSIERYFDYDKFGEDLLQNEEYIELPSGRVVTLNY